MVDRTPTPWLMAPTGRKLQGQTQPFAIAETGTFNLIAALFGDVKGGEEVAKANAAFVVRCVNSHADLVAALRCFLADERFQVAVGGNPIAVDRMLEQARAALAKASQ